MDSETREFLEGMENRIEGMENRINGRFDKLEKDMNERFVLVVKMLRIIDGRLKKVEATHEETF